MIGYNTQIPASPVTFNKSKLHGGCWYQWGWQLAFGYWHQGYVNALSYWTNTVISFADHIAWGDTKDLHFPTFSLAMTGIGCPCQSICKLHAYHITRASQVPQAPFGHSICSVAPSVHLQCCWFSEFHPHGKLAVHSLRYFGIYTFAGCCDLSRNCRSTGASLTFKA